jgi:hypothetical protein
MLALAATGSHGLSPVRMWNWVTHGSEQMTTRGVLYLVWGPKARWQPLLERAVTSLQTHHPELPVHVVGAPPGSDLRVKAQMFELSPFEETLFLDVDTVVLSRLDFGFEQARSHRLACAMNECPWASRYRGVRREMVEYNTGVLFFTREAEPIFDAWRRLTWVTDSRVDYLSNQGMATMPLNDQAAFARAVAAEQRQPFVLPPNYNFRPAFMERFWGPLRIWHGAEEVPAAIVNLSREMAIARDIVHQHRVAAEG